MPQNDRTQKSSVSEAAEADERAVYDIEVAPNLSILGVKVRGEAPQHFVIDKPLDGPTAERIEGLLNGGREISGYNNTGLDNYLLQAMLNGAAPSALHDIAQSIIGSREPAWKVAKDLGLQRTPFNELDLRHYTPRGRLKQYEARLGLAIEDLPFDPHAPLPEEQLPTVLRYLDHDLLATERLREAVEPEVQSRRLLEEMFGVAGLINKSASGVAASIVIDRYLKDNPELDIADFRAEATRSRNCTFEFHVPQWVREGIQGTLAERIADQIDSTTFHVIDGVRQPPDRPWPEVIELEPDGLKVNFGLGGLHSQDTACHYSAVSYDVASLYPQIIMHPECTPSHLNEAEFHRIYGQIIERRLQAKREGDKRTSNALKLVLNSCFGAFNFAYSPLYSPDAFLNITVSGQLALLALADELNQIGLRCLSETTQPGSEGRYTVHPSERTRVVSLNTDSVMLQAAPGDEAAVVQVIERWERRFAFQMERTEVLQHRGLNVNSYIEIVREGNKPPEIKSKGTLAHDPDFSADHDRVIVNQAIGQWMLDGTDVEVTIRQAAARREILKFTEMRSAPSSGLRVDGQPVGRIARVYRSKRTDLPRITKDATEKVKAQQLEGGFAYLSGTDWPTADDVDIDWYVRQARVTLAQTSTPYRPHHNRLARELTELGLQVAGLGGAATVLDGERINEQAIRRGTEKNPRNHAGDRGLAVSVAKSANVVALPPGHAPVSSLVLSYGTSDGVITGEIHDRTRLQAAVGSLTRLQKSCAWWTDKGYVTVYDPGADIWPIGTGAAVTREQASATPAEPSIGANAVVPQELHSNDDFLKLMFGPDIDLAFVCSNTIPPDLDDPERTRGMWAGGPIEFAQGWYLLPERQNYTCVSGFYRDEVGEYRRRQEQFAGLYFVVLDDIGKKVTVDPRSLGFGEPTLINETSPGNFQWIYRLTQPVESLSTASYLMKEVLAMPVQGHLMTDQGARGVTRLCKLPFGTNFKRALAEPWRNRIVSWRPELAYSAEEIAGWFGAKLSDAPLVRADAAAAAVDSESHSVIQAFAAEDRLLSGQKSNGWWDIECIQAELHSKGDRSGTAIKIRPDGSWTMKCQHGHCAELGRRDMFRWLLERGHAVPDPAHRDDVQRLDRERLAFGPLGAQEDAQEDAPAEGEVDAAGLDERLDEGRGEEVNDAPEPASSPQGPKQPLGPASGSALAQRKRPTIYLKPGEIDLVVLQCAALINDEVFKRGSSLVRIGEAQEIDDGVQRSFAQKVVIAVNRQWLICELSARACFLRWSDKARGWRRVDCPANIAAAVELGTRDNTFKELAALATVPYLRRDGSVYATPGYDPATHIYYAPSLEFPPIPDQPTREQARAALEELKALVAQFPFANDVSRSVFLADVLTAIARPTLPTSPAVVYAATMAGTGKTLMASIANLIAYGHGTTHPWPQNNDEEVKKVFTSILIAGDPVIVFDNVPNGVQIKSAALSQFTTSDEYADRRLGESERVKFKNRTRVVLTGNNVTLASDNARRALICELQLDVESPRERKIVFEQPDLPGYIKANRPRLIAAALTVLRAYAICTEPLRQVPLESFEQWSWRVRDALVWLGEADPVAAVQFENDGSGDIAEAFRQIAVVARAKARGGAQPRFRASELAGWVGGNLELRDAMQAAGCTDPTSSASLGYWLRSLKNRIAGGLRLEAQGVAGSRVAVQWQLVVPAINRQAA